MTVGRSPRQGSLVGSSEQYCRDRVSENSIYGLLHRESARLFPDESFSDLFRDIGRRSVPPRIVAVVMVLQRAEGLSDREAVDRFSFDLRWKYAAGGLEFDYPGFVHTVLVDMRARLRASARPDRIFETVLEVCRKAGLVGRRRVMDSTALYDAVATQDTVTLIRSAIRGLLRVADAKLSEELRSVVKRDDDYAAPGKPSCDWNDDAAKEALIDDLARDALALLESLEGRTVSAAVGEAMQLLATVVGQDLDKGDDGVYRIARRVAVDRIISTVDTEARHGHKTSARGFDGYKGHISVDPDSEIIVASEVTAGNVGDGQAAGPLVDEAIEHAHESNESVEVYGDASYGTADIVELLEKNGLEANVKVQQPAPSKKGLFSKGDFDIDLNEKTVRCPNGVVVPIKSRKGENYAGLARFGASCQTCPLRASCTTSKNGRLIRIHTKESVLQRSRLRQNEEAWRRNYRATRPKVERKIAHLMRRRHGGRRSRVRGRERIRHDFSLLCAAANLARLAKLGFRLIGVTWAVLASLVASCGIPGATRLAKPTQRPLRGQTRRSARLAPVS